MATSGFMHTQLLDNILLENKVWCRFEWTRDSYSQEDNTSTIYWSVSLLEEPLPMLYGNVYRRLSMSIDGIPLGFITVGNPKNNLYYPIQTGYTTIKHDDDGSKTFAVSIKVGRNPHMTYSGAEDDDKFFTAFIQTFTLDSIEQPITPDEPDVPVEPDEPVDNSPKLLTAPDFTDEENPTITYSNPLGEAMAGLQACIANSKGTEIYVPYRMVNKTGSSYTFNLTIEERNTLRAAAGDSPLAVRFYLRYWLNAADSPTHLFISKTMYLEDITPELHPVARDVDTTIVALTGDNQSVILGYSDIYFEIGVTPPTGTSIITQWTSCGGYGTSTNNGTFTNVSSNIVRFSATDSRGNTATDSIELDVVPYIKLTCNQSVHLNLDGSVDLIVKGNCFSGSFGEVDNTLSIQNRYRESGGEWGDWNTIDVLISDFNNNSYTLTATMSGFDPSGTYEFQSRAIDKLSSVESGVNAVTLKPIFDWGKYDFNFNVPISIEGYPVADYIIETGTESMGSNGTWYWAKWKSGKAECYGRRNYGIMDISTAWGSLYRSEPFSQDLPYGLFAHNPEYVDITMDTADRGAWIAMHEEVQGNAEYTGSFIVVRPAATTLTFSYLRFHCIGRWK